MVVMDTDELLDSLGFFQDGFNVLDIGSGFGYIPKYTLKYNKSIQYLGIDIKMKCIQHCKNLFQGIGGYQFRRLNINSDTYNPMSSISPLSMELGLEDSSIDSVICHSLFTHLDTEAIASHYMNEIKRVMKPDGLLWTTWFTSPPNIIGGGTNRTVYDLLFVYDILKGFRTIHSYGGETNATHDQLYIASTS